MKWSATTETSVVTGCEMLRLFLLAAVGAAGLLSVCAVDTRDYRLPENIVPKHYILEIITDLDEFNFEGKVWIKVSIVFIEPKCHRKLNLNFHFHIYHCSNCMMWSKCRNYSFNLHDRTLFCLNYLLFLAPLAITLPLHLCLIYTTVHFLPYITLSTDITKPTQLFLLQYI